MNNRQLSILQNVFKMSAMIIDASATRTFVGENPERTSIPIMFAPERLKHVRKVRTIISESTVSVANNYIL